MPGDPLPSGGGGMASLPASASSAVPAGPPPSAGEFSVSFLKAVFRRLSASAEYIVVRGCRAKAHSHMAGTVSALVDNQRRRLPRERVLGVKRLTDGREILLLTTAEGYIRSAKADVRQPIGVYAVPGLQCSRLPFCAVRLSP